MTSRNTCRKLPLNVAIEAALSYANKGFRVFPVHGIRPDGRCTCNQAKNCSPGKHPIPFDGLKSASTDHTQIMEWWERFPHANCGVATGPASGLFVVDLDGEDGVREFEAIFGQIEAPTVATGGKGKHLWFSYPGAVDLRNGAKLHGIPVDVRGDGGYVVAPPSKHISGGAYQWIKGLADLPAIPQDLIDWILSSKERKVQSTVLTQTNRLDSRSTLETAPGVCEGQRHSKLLEYVGRDLATGESVNNVLRRAYEWAGRCSPPMDADEVARVVNDLSRSETIKREAKTARIQPMRFRILSYGELRKRCPNRKPELIEGICRVAETWNLVAASKVGKSWMSYGLVISVSLGLCWLDRFRCRKGRVLLIDNELEQEEISFRLGQVAKAMGVDEVELDKQLDALSLRGDILNINEIGPAVIDHLDPNEYAMIVVDAKYRAVTGGENDNDDQRDFYNLVDKYAKQTSAVWVLVHHSTKGDQSSKAVTDVGAGGGSQSRAADVHMVLRDHEEEGCAVLDAAIRSNPPITPVVVRFAWPVWVRQQHLDPRDIKTPQGKREAAQGKNDRETTNEIRRILKDADGPLSLSAITSKSKFGRSRLQRGIALLFETDELTESEESHANGRPFFVYQLSSPIATKIDGRTT